MTLTERAYALPAMGELRVTAARGAHEPTVVTLQPQAEEGADGPRADVFGTELLPGVAVRLPPGRSVGVFSPTGCSLVVSAPHAVLQASYATACAATNARSLADINTHLEVLRVKARRGGADALGPRVLFVADRRAAGTSTYVRTLVNYAVRLGYHPLLLDAAAETPRFGYPGLVALYAMQHTVDIEEEMCFAPAMHGFQGVGRHEDPALFTQVLRQLMRLATERMARSDRCRVGGVFVDYGTVSRSLVEEAEAWECSEERPEEHRKTNPLDVLVDAVAEADIDHVFVVGSAWLRFKIAQRVQQRAGGSQLKPFVAPATVTCTNGMSLHLFLVDATECGVANDDVFFRRQRWLQYFFGTRTTAVKPTLLTVSLSLVRLVAVGRGEASSMSTFMPMADDDPQQGRRATVPPVSLTYVQPQDVELKDRILALSSATELEELPDGTLHRVPFAVFEARLRQGLVVGFALVESVSPSRITLLTSAAAVRKDTGLCFILTEERLATQVAAPTG
ncbi:mucin-associated surface protein (MASP) [Trypanosoma conorhini]|uniref:Mucin-associated surface protein (MASP) n=1 Tax=Trypanosoma conorhini TaxID=83891 RepID=A0A3R7RKZ6_9TRYP|nr:mucin-associated surface protein (MASP) [Trypanosoma conorhini]RNF06258.1 mucin-associated surface protein (MASP) [Trypanosoma conorhini]